MKEDRLYFQMQQDLAPYLPMLGKAADAIVDQDVSRYPIFVVHRYDLELGIPLMAHGEAERKWSIHATTLEELVTKRLIQADKVAPFRQVYKNSQEYLCIFFWTEVDASFVFLPRH